MMILLILKIINKIEKLLKLIEENSDKTENYYYYYHLGNLYAETEKSIAKRQQVAEQNRYFREPGAALKGRPTKKNRRLLDKSNA